MRFIKFDEIQLGMRTAKPIYSRTGVLLYGRNTLVSDSFINNIGNLDLYGLYILEPTEPLPPMSEDEMEFEKFQTVTCYALKKELDSMIEDKPFDVESIAMKIVKNYGRLKQKINYIQTIRSNEDYPYKHSLSVAMLCSLICNRLKIDMKETTYIVNAALVHDLGKIIAPDEIINKSGKLSGEELKIIRDAELKGFDIVKKDYFIPAGIRRYIAQLAVANLNKRPGYAKMDQKLLLGTKIIMVADMFDILTAMRVYKDPMSGFSAIKFFQDKEEEFDEKIILALTESINILPIGACVELTSGEKGLVLAESEYYLLRPRVLGFNSNTIYDLSQKKVYDKIQIRDIIKTMDNRFVMDGDMSK